MTLAEKRAPKPFNRKGGKTEKETGEKGYMKVLFLNILLIDAGIFSFVGILTLLKNLNFGTALVWSGLIMLGVGSMAALGGWSVAPGEYNTKFDQKIPQLNYERSPEKWTDMHKSYSFFVYLVAASLAPIVTGYLIDH